MNVYSLWTLRELKQYLNNPPMQQKDGLWVPVLPLRYQSLWNDAKLAWLVFRGKAQAFTDLNIHEIADL